MADMAKVLIFLGGLFIMVGVAIIVLGKMPGLGKLPGDILIKKNNFTLYFPIVTCLLVSIILSIVLSLWQRR